MEQQQELSSCSASARAMDIFEIRSLVGLYLDCQQRALCSMVSKAWRNTFSPMIYLSVDLSTEFDIFQGSSSAGLPPEDLIRRHGETIKDLSICLPGSYIRVLLSTVRHLESLKVVRTTEQCTSQNGPVELRLLMEFNSSLQKLEFVGFQGPLIATSLKEIGPTCHQLKRLSFIQSNLSLERIVDIMRIAPQVTRLSIDRCIVAGFVPGRIFTQPLFPHLEHLEFVNSGDHLVVLVPATTRSLQPPEERTVDESSTFWLYPKLRTLIVRGQLKKAAPLQRLLRQCPQMTEFTLHGSPFTYDTFRLLSSRFDMLTRIDLLESGMDVYYTGAGANNFMICDEILWSCSQLVYFGYPDYGDRLDYPSYELRQYGNEESRVWTCSGLKTLKFKQLQWSRRVSWNERTMEQLSTLTALEVFEVGSMSGKADDEIRQMAQAWPRLGRFSCLRSSLPAQATSS
ncbi:hypothetical protein EMPS_06570 [Entomortierella parvispora]|uniref:F-box domain-containing protein n=1 Tax=Entomortierella parvispora TaxID=205924 RepID=A0A9P3LXK9_9FUNG|nr:hypothetical protein EMPS_06570 [Entomortierella parvispora]